MPVPDITIAPWARIYIGIPFLSGGRSHSSSDCYGLLRMVWTEQYGIDMPLLSGRYGNAVDFRETEPLFSALLPLLAGKPHTVPQTGDAAVILNGGKPTHLGVYAGAGYILHTTVQTGSVLQRMTDRDLAGRIEGYYGIKTPDTDTPVLGTV
jgi:murein DD-endopeptidase / murein LD-carboxypeptidase